MMASLAGWLLESVEGTVVCLFSGCVSVLAVVLSTYAIIFLVSSGATKFFRRKSDANRIGKKPLANGSCEYTVEVTVASDNLESSLSVSGERNNKVRQYLEQLIGSLVRANLNDVPLTPLSNDVQYEIFFEKYLSKLSSKLTALSTSLLSDKDSESLDENVRPSTLYNDLTSLIRDIRDAAALLPPLSADDENDYGSVSMEERLRDKNYEEILSIAVLNEIISNSQKGKDASTSSADEQDFRKVNKVLNLSSPEFDCYDVGSRLPNSSTKHLYTVENKVEEIISTERRLVSSEEENDAINNDDDIVESPIEYSITRCNLMEKHRAHFPELGKDVIDVGYNSYDEDNVTEMVNSVDSWEDNWLFRRKKRSRIKNSVSVPMLVPNPSQTYRALIGGVDVDDTSDLSECSTNSVTEEPLSHSFVSTHDDFSDASRTEYIYNYHFASHADLANVAMVAATETDNNDAISDRDRDSSGITSISRDTCTISDICSGDDHLSSFDRDVDDECLSQWWDDIAECKSNNAKTGDFLAAQEDSGEGSLETESEPEQKLDADQSCQSRSPSESQPPAQTDANAVNEIHDTPDEQLREDATCAITFTVEEDLATPPKPGTIAEREHLKWQQAAPIPNNPYSKESIEKRNLDTLLPKNRYYDVNGVPSISTNPSSFVDTATTGKQFEGWCDGNQEFSQSTASLYSLEGSSVSGSNYERDYYVNTNGERHESVNKQRGHSEGRINENDHKSRNSVADTDHKVSERGATNKTNENASGGRGTNLVRVSSWCERKQAKPTVEAKVSERLPSVKELAKQFSLESTPATVRRSIQPTSRRPLHDQVHSLTARSMSREFREGLKNNATKAFNRNVQISLIGDAYRPSVPSDSKQEVNHNDGVDEVLPLRNGKIVSSVDLGNV